MKKAIMFLIVAGVCHGMSLKPAQNLSTDSISLDKVVAVLEKSPEETAQNVGRTMYFPQHYDATGFLEKELGCCFCVGRCILQPLSVVAPLASALLVGLGEYYINTDSKVAGLLNGLGLGASIAGFVTNVLMIKINNKLEYIDKHLGERKQQPADV